MLLLFFPPPATGWHVLTDDAESVNGVRQHRRKWVHTAARTVATLPAPGKQIGSVVMGPWRNWQRARIRGTESPNGNSKRCVGNCRFDSCRPYSQP
jgi:hypothetical protein